MGNNQVEIKQTSKTSEMIDTLFELSRITFSELKDDEFIKIKLTKNQTLNPNDDQKEILSKQDEIIKRLLNKKQMIINDIKIKYQKHSTLFIHFNDGDGDDITLEIQSGFNKLNINGRSVNVIVNEINPPIIKFTYNTGNEWKWIVNLDSKECTGESQRTFKTKKLSSQLNSDSSYQLKMCD